MKNPFKRKNKISKGHKFLEGLSKAVNLNKNTEKYKLKYFTILEKSDDLELTKKARMRYRTLLENIEKAEKENSLNPTSTLVSVRAAIEESKKNPNIFISEKHYNQLETLRKPNKIKKWFYNIKSKINENWELTKEFLREIQYWLIAEYTVFTKLSYALNKKKSEIKVRKAFKSNKSIFINMYGYDKGMHRFYEFTKSINNGVLMHKRMAKRDL